MLFCSVSFIMYLLTDHNKKQCLKNADIMKTGEIKKCVNVKCTRSDYFGYFNMLFVHFLPRFFFLLVFSVTVFFAPSAHVDQTQLRNFRVWLTNKNVLLKIFKILNRIKVSAFFVFQQLLADLFFFCYHHILHCISFSANFLWILKRIVKTAF